MNPAIKRVGMVVMACATVALAHAGDKTHGVSAKDRAQITALFAAHDASIAASDLDAFYKLTTNDYVEMIDGGPDRMGRDAARAGFAEFLTANSLSMKSEIRELEVIGNVAWVSTSTSQVRTPKDGSTRYEIHGKALMILHRTPEGWKIKTNMWNFAGRPTPIT